MIAVRRTARPGRTIDATVLVETALLLATDASLTVTSATSELVALAAGDSVLLSQAWVEAVENSFHHPSPIRLAAERLLQSASFASRGSQV